MGKHLGPRTLEPKCFTLKPKCRYPEFRKTSLRRNVSQRTLEPNGPLKHTIYKMSAHTIVTHTQTRGTIGRVSGRKVSTGSRLLPAKAGVGRSFGPESTFGPEDRKNKKTKILKNTSDCAET